MLRKLVVAAVNPMLNSGSSIIGDHDEAAGQHGLRGRSLATGWSRETLRIASAPSGSVVYDGGRRINSPSNVNTIALAALQRISAASAIAEHRRTFVALTDHPEIWLVAARRSSASVSSYCALRAP